MHGQSAHLDLCATSSVERYTIWISSQNTSCNKQQAQLDRRLLLFALENPPPQDFLTCAGPPDAFLAPSRSDITDIATASRIIGGAVDEITIHHTLGRPYAPSAGLGRLSSIRAAAAIALHVSSGHYQQRQLRKPKLSEQQQPSSTLLTLQARLGRLSSTRWLTVGCPSNFYETLFSELRSNICRKRPGRLPC
jgi:hypothetical protein